jgi:hypothetical protein
MTCRECRAVAAPADVQRVINRPKAKKERIAFAPMNLPLDERSRLCRDRSGGPLGEDVNCPPSICAVHNLQTPLK